MFDLFSQRLLTLLQLTRMALVFTAISNSLCALLLWARWNVGEDGSIRSIVHWPLVIAMAIVSAGLYGFGMSLNDIIDRRRDSQIAAHRPIPSGRIGVRAAHIVCTILAIAAVLAGLYVTRQTGAGSRSFVLILCTAALIVFYDFAGKYLVAMGLITLGLIRFAHATIAAPRLPLVWHPLLLLNHVAIISMIAYLWEAKRPQMTKRHWWAALGGLAVVDLMCTVIVGWRRMEATGARWSSAMWVTSGLIYPAIAVVAFVALAITIYRVNGPTRRGGQTLMLYGLLWLIVYDAAFAFGYVSAFAAGLIVLFLPMAYFSVQVMRWWGKLMSLSHKPEFQRAV